MAFFVAAWFACVGIVWVLALEIHALLGWILVALCSGVLYLVARRATTRLARANAVLQEIVDCVGDGLLVLGRDRRIVYANPAALAMLDVADESELIGMGATEFSRRFFVSYPSGILVRPDAFVSQRAFTEPGPLHYKAVLHPSDSRELVILSTASAVRHASDEPAELVVSIMHDITDGENFDRMRDQLFSAAAHALKTPAAIIKANVQHMAARVSATVQPSINAVQRQCERIDRLVQNLLVVSRARSRTLELHPQEIDLAPLVQSVVRDLASPIGAEISAMPRVRGDIERLALVVRNLALDAVHAARARSPVTLELVTAGDEAELVARYTPLRIAERTYAGSEDYDDSTLSRCATETIVEAHGGSAGLDEGDTEARLWVHLPTVQEAA